MKKQELINEITYMYQRIDLIKARSIIEKITGWTYVKRNDKKEVFEKIYNEFKVYVEKNGISNKKIHGDNIFYY